MAMAAPEPRTSEHHTVLIVGTGFAGLGMAHRLAQAGIHDFVLLEKSDSVGGTWRDNTYPGLACDIPSHLYSFSFEPNPDWSRLFAPQAEIRAYLERCADRHGIRARIRFGAEVVSADFDERTGRWTVRARDGRSFSGHALVSGSGHALTQPVTPELPGQDRFGGKVMHSARWDHSYSLEGKRVAVVGTGASAVQIIPAIAGRVSKLHVLQRTAAWVFPKPDGPTPALARDLFRQVPAAQKVARGLVYGIFESFALGHVYAPELNRLHELRARRFLEKSVRDPDLRRKLTPSFRFGCKRILLSNDYYPALQRPNVELVTEGIRELRPGAIVTADGKAREVDAIVWATGYVAAETAPPFPIRGRGGRDLAAEWKKGGEAHLGTTVAGFPNLFFVIGPNCGLGHNSMIYMMESQFEYILGAVRKLEDEGLAYLDVSVEEQRRYNDWVQARLSRSVWNRGGCQSWYLTRDGKNTTVWPGFTFEFRARTRRFDEEHYEAVRPEAEALTAALASARPA